MVVSSRGGRTQNNGDANTNMEDLCAIIDYRRYNPIEKAETQARYKMGKELYMDWSI